MLTVILISYLVIMFGVSVWANKFNSSAEDFLLAGRRLGVFLAAFTLAATYFGGGYVVGLGAEAYSSGMIAWYNGLAGAVGILAVCLVLKKMEGMQLYTVAELLETRYGSPLLRFLCAMLSLLALIGILSGQVNSAGSILSSIGIGSPVVGGLIAAAFFIGYTVVGGLWAVTITDFIQIIVAGAGIIAATFFTVNKLGGLERYGRGGELADFRKLFYHDPGGGTLLYSVPDTSNVYLHTHRSGCLPETFRRQRYEDGKKGRNSRLCDRWHPNLFPGYSRHCR